MTWQRRRRTDANCRVGSRCVADASKSRNESTGGEAEKSWRRRPRSAGWGYLIDCFQQDWLLRWLMMMMLLTTARWRQTCRLASPVQNPWHRVAKMALSKAAGVAPSVRDDSQLLPACPCRLSPRFFPQSLDFFWSKAPTTRRRRCDAFCPDNRIACVVPGETLSLVQKCRPFCDLALLEPLTGFLGDVCGGPHRVHRYPITFNRFTPDLVLFMERKSTDFRYSLNVSK